MVGFGGGVLASWKQLWLWTLGEKGSWTDTCLCGPDPAWVCMAPPHNGYGDSSTPSDLFLL